MRFRITESPCPRGNPQLTPTPRSMASLRSNTSRAFECTARSPNGMGGDRRLWLSARALSGTAGPQGTFGYPATCAVVNGERRSRALKSRRGLSFRSIGGTVEMFFGNPGNRPAPKAGHLTYSLVSKRLSGRLLRAMLLSGTFETCQPALNMSADRGKPEVLGDRLK